MVLIGSLLACVSSVPFEAGYGVPAAPLIVSSQVHTVPQPLLHSIPAPAAPLPLQLLHSAPVLQQAPIPLPHSAPLVHSVPHPVVHSAPGPVQVAGVPFGVGPAFAPAPFPLGVAPAPLPFAAAPAPLSIAPAPLPIPATPSSQFHAQDEFGQFSFGYENINSAKTETRDAFGVTRGSYQYVDANGILQTVNYIADPVNGFRVAGTNIPVAAAVPNVALPVAPVAPVAAPLIAPVPVLETPEVAKARAEHLAAHEEVKAANAAAVKDTSAERKKREAEPIEAGYGTPGAPLIVQSLPVPLVHNAPAPILNHFVHPAPVAPTPAFFPDARNFVPINQVFQPEQFSFVPAPVPEPFAASGPVPLPLAQGPIPLDFAPAPLPIAQGPAPLAFAQGPAPLAFAQGPAPLAFAQGPAPLPLAQASAPLPLAQGPAPLAFAPVPVAIPSTPSSQFHAQDEFGQFSFGYENVNSAKTETRDAFGITRGSYQYVDANGILQTVNYIADPVNGFRVAGTNIPVAPAAQNVALPVAPKAPVVEPLVAPVPVMETPEVAAARAEHLAAHEEAKSAVAAAAVEDKTEPTTEAEL